MSETPLVSKDAWFINLNNELRDLRRKREKTRPAVYIMLALLLGLAGLVMPTPINLVVFLFAVASVPAAISSAVKLARLNRHIDDVEARIEALKTAP